MLNQSLENLFLSVFDNIFQKNIFIFQRSYFCRQSIYRCNFISPKLIKDTKFAAFIFVFVYLFFKLLLSDLFTERITYLVNTIKLAVVIYGTKYSRTDQIKFVKDSHWRDTDCLSYWVHCWISWPIENYAWGPGHNKRLQWRTWFWVNRGAKFSKKGIVIKL